MEIMHYLLIPLKPVMHLKHQLPEKLIPTIDQLFKRSFSHELEEIIQDCGGEQLLLLDQLVNNVSGDNFVVLDDIHSIITEK